MFQSLDEIRPDALMIVGQRFRADDRADKLDLGVGVYRDAEGAASIMQVVKQAEAQLVQEQQTKSYLPADGDANYARLMAERALGADSAALTDGRVTATQCPGGTGALHQALALLKHTGKRPTVWVGTPTWPNHIPMLNNHHFDIQTYDYFDIPTQSLQFDAMMDALGKASAGDVILLHGVCHNPTGADLNEAQWREMTDLIGERGLIPLFDFAYQGFGHGDDADAFGVRMMAAVVPEMMIASSCSKSFGLYRERTGILVTLCESAAQAKNVKGALQTLARLNYSNPPDHGGAIVRTILSDPALKASWQAELKEMRERVLAIRAGLKTQGQAQSINLDYVAGQTGLFTTFDMDSTQTDRLADEYAIHMPSTGRINISGLAQPQIPRFVEALKAVMG